MPVVVDTVDFTRTIPQIVKMVLRKLGALGIDEEPTAEDTYVVREAIDLRLKELHELGILWFNVGGAATDLSLTAGVASKSLSTVTDFLFAVSCAVRIGTDDYPLQIISHREYQAIPNKSESGDPEKVFFSPDATAYFWPVPSSNLTAKLTYEAIASDTDTTGAPDVPVSMIRPLVTIVASDLIEDFDVSDQKAARIRSAFPEAMSTIRLLNAERVDSTPIQATYF